jgi:hypothetical protein
MGEMSLGQWLKLNFDAACVNIMKSSIKSSGRIYVLASDKSSTTASSWDLMRGVFKNVEDSDSDAV